MTRAYWPNLLFLAAIWGASYLFIKVAVEEIEPAPMMFLRCAISAVILVGFLAWRTSLAESAAALRAAAVPSFVLGVLNAALPFWLIAWGEQYVDSGVAAIANATVPIFNALLVIRFLPTERLSRERFGGVLAGLVGVGVLTGGQPEAGGLLAVAGTLAVVVASLSYAAGGVYAQIEVAGTAGLVLAAGSMTAGALVLLPAAAWQMPRELPSAEATGSLLALAVAGTAVAQLILYRLLRLHGSSRMVLVTYLMPPIALLYGAVLLAEAVTPWSLGGLALILGGVAIGSGKMRRRPQRA